MTRPLSGVRIIDLTIVVAGPVATALLGDLGAELIKVENTVARQIIGVAPPKREAGQPPPTPGHVRAASFSDLNRSKKGITLNLNLPEARDVLKRLVAVSDVVIDNFSPRVMRNFGLEYEDLVNVKPDIIAVSMPAFGKTGPFRDRTSFGPGIDALSGLSHLTGYPDSTPLKPGNYYCDYNAGALAAMAVMAALFRRRRTGKGQFIEVAMRDGLTQVIGESVLDYVLNRRVQSRRANSHSTMAPHGMYRCRGEDRWLAIAVRDDEEWRALCEVIGRPELAEDPSFATVLARKENEVRLDQIVGDWSRTQDASLAAEALQAAGVPASPAMTTEDVAKDPQFAYRKAFQDVEMFDGTKARFQRAGWTAKNARLEVHRGPNYSEHTIPVLQDLLGMSEAHIEALAAAGALVLPEEVQP